MGLYPRTSSHPSISSNQSYERKRRHPEYQISGIFYPIILIKDIFIIIKKSSYLANQMGILVSSRSFKPSIFVVDPLAIFHLLLLKRAAEMFVGSTLIVSYTVSRNWRPGTKMGIWREENTNQN